MAPVRQLSVSFGWYGSRPSLKWPLRSTGDDVIAGVLVEIHCELESFGKLCCSALLWAQGIEEVGERGAEGDGKGHYDVEHRRLHDDYQRSVLPASEQDRIRRYLEVWCLSSLDSKSGKQSTVICGERHGWLNIPPTCYNSVGLYTGWVDCHGILKCHRAPMRV